MSGHIISNGLRVGDWSTKGVCRGLQLKYNNRAEELILVPFHSGNE